MYLLRLLPALLVSSLSALQAYASPPPYPIRPYQKPGPDDVRSPCPGLNAFANHGYMAHSGRGLSIADIVAAAHAAVNIESETIETIANFSFGLQGVPLDGTIDLDILNEHPRKNEMDASLSRADTFFGDNHSFNATVWAQTSSFFSGGHSTFETMAMARKARREDSEATNPEFDYNRQIYELLYGAAALLLSTMGDPETGVAPVEFLDIFVKEGRLPAKEGWRPTEKAFTTGTLSALAGKMKAASGEVPPGM